MEDRLQPLVRETFDKAHAEFPNISFDETFVAALLKRSKARRARSLAVASLSLNLVLAVGAAVYLIADERTLVGEPRDTAEQVVESPRRVDVDSVVDDVDELRQSARVQSDVVGTGWATIARERQAIAGELMSVLTGNAELALTSSQAERIEKLLVLWGQQTPEQNRLQDLEGPIRLLEQDRIEVQEREARGELHLGQ